MEKPNVRVYLTVTLSCLLLLSCRKDWLDKKPDIHIVVPSTLLDCQALLDNATTVMNISPGLGECASDGHYLTDAAATSYLTDVDRNAYTWSHNSPNVSVADWNNLYTTVFYCNLVLETLKKVAVTAENGDNFNDIKGQALFHRARCFFELSQLFSPMYNANSENNAPSIPLRLETDITIRTTRSTVEAVYDRILKDLNEAKQDLKATSQYKTRPNLTATYAMLARVYLSIQEYNLAGSYADSCLAINNVLLDYNQVDSLQFNPFDKYNSEVIFYTKLVLWEPLYPYDIRIDTSLYGLYSDDDLRKTLYFNFNYDGIGFKGFYGETPFGGLAIDEQYLISAEAYARNGNVNNAMARLNGLLATRWRAGKFTKLTASSASDALKIVLQERRKELLLRGTRWSDLRRLNTESEFKIDLTRTLLGKTYKLIANSFQYTFPIPDDIRQQTGIQQNPGW